MWRRILLWPLECWHTRRIPFLYPKEWVKSKKMLGGFFRCCLCCCWCVREGEPCGFSAVAGGSRKFIQNPVWHDFSFFKGSGLQSTYLMVPLDVRSFASPWLVVEDV